jgi:hypothetical protein
MRRLVESLKRTFEPLAAQKQLKFVVDMTADMPPSIFTDSRRLEQILKNLLSNAVKFTDAGTIELALGLGQRQSGAICRNRLGYRHCAGTPAGDFRGVPSSRWHHQPALWRHGPGPVDLARSCNAARRRDPRQQHARRRKHVRADATHALDGRQRAGGKHPERHCAAPAPAPAPAVVAPTQPPVSRTQDVAAYDDDRANWTPGRRSVLVIEDDLSFAGILFELAHEMRTAAWSHRPPTRRCNLPRSTCPMPFFSTSACRTGPASRAAAVERRPAHPPHSRACRVGC